MNNPKTQLTLLGIAAGILLALLIAPQTRWLVRFQISPSALLRPGRYEQQKQAFVRQHPVDYQVQLAGKSDDNKQTQIEYARSLVPRFPDNASLRANILRYAADKGSLQRDEDYLVGGQPAPVHRDRSGIVLPTPAQLAAFDADAAAGEQLNPNNAFFPFMRSIGLFAAHRDTEGLAAVQRASTKHIWQEYFEDEAEGHWRINNAIYGGREAIGSAAVSAAVLFPHYQSLRAVARIVAYKAILDEQAGHPEAGLAKRQALGRCGELMGIQANSIIGNLVGVAINAISRSRPGGVPPLKSLPQISGEQQSQIRLKLYCDYVTRIGHPEAAAQAQKDNQNWQQIHRVTSHIDDFYFGIGQAGFNRLMTALVVGWAIFPAMFVLLLLGAAGVGLSRLPRLQARLPLPAGAAAGFWSIVVVGAVLTAVYFDAGPVDFPIYVPVLLLPPLLFLAFRLVFRPQSRRPIGIALLAIGVTLGGLGLLAAIVSWQMRGGMELILAMRQMLGLSGTDANGNPPATDAVSWLQMALGVAVTLALPLLTAIVLSIWSRVKRVPVSLGLVTGFQAVVPALVLGLMLVYGGLVLWTVPQEARANYGLERSLHGEGQYLAEVTGLAWPKEENGRSRG